jgi:hypothetical protein
MERRRLGRGGEITVGPVTHLDLKAVSATPVAGATNNLTITAQDANDATVTTYTGSRNLTFSGASASPNATVPTVVNSAGSAIAFGSATAINFSAGVATVSSSKNGVMRLYRSGATSVAVSDGTLASVTPLAVTVNTASASKLAFAKPLDQRRQPRLDLPLHLLGHRTRQQRHDQSQRPRRRHLRQRSTR